MDSNVDSPQVSHNIPIYETSKNQNTVVRCDVYCKKNIHHQSQQLYCDICDTKACWKCLALFQLYGDNSEKVVCKPCAIDHRLAVLNQNNIEIASDSPLAITFAGYAADDRLFMDEYGLSLKTANALTEHEKDLYHKSTCHIGTSPLDQYNLQKLFSLKLNMDGNVYSTWYSIDFVPVFFITPRILSHYDIDTASKILLRATKHICQKTDALALTSPQSFHFPVNYNPEKKIKLIKVNMKYGNSGVGYDFDGNPIRDLLNVDDICRNEYERQCLTRIGLLTMVLCNLNGFRVGMPDSVGLLYYLNRNLAGHVDYAQ
eukprot:299676_1